ncbi:O-acetyl-ADP-ribose deacetylase [Amphritea balenae]|uniref:O-acetyl-ADP-ribose deacetylase n=1 Tax=Amphritea balenae TaxID=452629 RepID=A0A3P1SKN2_9GAMM|nr:O-acetyl-ADP-ribose deacetylase [Amphritea balenae]RRC97833.1 O-acetyl-ADP-ribose deacetylase [Amphritea balenae]GGK82626.1 macro domain-containing protein [Amphritea balenae]
MIRVELGDITALQVGAIVNAANSSLLGGGGVDGAIHRAAGSGLLAECKTINGCPTGEARITGGYNLASEYVIHTVGPVWQGGERNEAQQLASCYRAVLDLCQQYRIKSVAFPAISCGIYGYPSAEAAKIALEVVTKGYLKARLEEVVFCCFDQTMAELYQGLLDAYLEKPGL